MIFIHTILLTWHINKFYKIVVVYDSFNVLLNSVSILMRLFKSIFIRNMDL